MGSETAQQEAEQLNGQTTGQAGQAAPAGNQVDLNSFFKGAYGQGREIERKTILAELGFNDLAEAKRILAETKSGSGQVNKKPDDLMSHPEIKAIIEQNKKLQEENQRTKEQAERQSVENDLMSAISRLNPANSKTAKMLSRELMDSYEFRAGKVYSKGSDIPLFAGTREMSVDDLVNNLSNDKEYQHFFNKGGIPRIINGQTGFQGAIRRPTKEEMTDALFKQAVQNTQQYTDLLHGRPLDFGKLEPEMEKLRKVYENSKQR